jgi:carbonic anhydrase
MSRLARRAALSAFLLLAQAASGGFEEEIRRLALEEAPAPAAAAPVHAAPLAAEHGGPSDPWQVLLEGNRRFAAGLARGPHRGLKRRGDLAAGQHPFAVVLACADSRVTPELLFDQGLGDLFVVRVAGNVAGPFDRASLEYGVEHLHIPLLVVLGHESCGAVKATLETAQKPGSEAALSPDLQALVKEIGPAVKGKGPEQLDEGVRANAQRSAQRLLEQSAVLRQAVAEGKLKVLAARYDLDQGRVEALP